MQLLGRLVFLLIRHQAKLRFLAKAQKTGTLAYLRVLKGSRRVLMALLGAFLMLQIMVLAAFGSLVTGFLLWDAEPHFKLQILFGIFLALCGLPVLVLGFLFSERLWYKVSGAEKLVAHVLKQNQNSEPDGEKP